MQLSVAGVVTPGPDIVRAGLVGCPPQISQHPDSRPQPPDERVSRKDDVHLHDPPGEAELVPALDHAAGKIGLLVLPSLVHVIVPSPSCLLQDRVNMQEAVLSVYGAGVVKLHGATAGGARIVIRLVQRGPHRVVAVLERAIGHVELVGHDLIRPENGNGHSGGENRSYFSAKDGKSILESRGAVRAERTK